MPELNQCIVHKITDTDDFKDLNFIQHSLSTLVNQQKHSNTFIDWEDWYKLFTPEWNLYQSKFRQLKNKYGDKCDCYLTFTDYNMVASKLMLADTQDDNYW